MFLCIELCNCFFLNRSQYDVYDSLDGQNCLPESVQLGDSQRCNCANTEKRTIASKKKEGNIYCFEGPNIDGKNTNLPFHLI